MNSKADPPESCLLCDWHTYTYSPTTGGRTLWYDYCSYLKMSFGKMHIILRGEYRYLSKHDEEDLEENLPYECPFFDASRVFWEMPQVVKMQADVFLVEVWTHTTEYMGYYIYGLREVIDDLANNIPKSVGLYYLYVPTKDVAWFIKNFGEKSVLISAEDPAKWVYNPPIQPI